MFHNKSDNGKNNRRISSHDSSHGSPCAILMKWYRVLACAVLACLLLPAAALARGLIDTGKPVSLTIQYPCQDAAFQIYRVAEVSSYGEYTLTGDFKGYSVSLDQPDQAGWRALAATLEGYAARDGLQALAEGKTDANGRVTFTRLEPGMYLVTGEKHTTGRITYTPEPFLVSLPGLDEKDNWVYEVTADPKYEQENEEHDGGTVTRKVLKVWDDGGTEKRPESVTVQLLRNGNVYDTVTLSEENRWSHTWSGLDRDYTWQIVEADVPESYTVTVTREGITFVVTNTRQGDVPEEPTPEPPNQPSGPDEPDEGNPDGPEPGPSLPQTGTLWWLVPLLACGGMALFLVGWDRRRNEERNET